MTEMPYLCWAFLYTSTGVNSYQFLFKILYTARLSEDITVYVDIWNSFIALGEMLGFTWEEIEEAYLRKNAVNHERQNSGY
ncbi:UNVERIFIED_ORG: dUTPase-like protein [Anoxybacillus amylolyticus]